MNKYNSNRKSEDLLEGISFIMSNKVKTVLVPSLFSGLIYEIILNKNIIHLNSDLPEFINTKFLSTFNSGKKSENQVSPYKDYLFKSRTNLAARLSRLIIEEFSYDDVRKQADWLSEYISNADDSMIQKSEFGSKSKKNTDLSSEIMDWTAR
ncbi:hypothetical protein [Weissella cibaria]|uniref:hypothetical protein n=1 Tax=Weissella cibaria TaxID=137591 RepID=UPI0022E3EBD0|nr:hypothetical protein [Weissella cibaria]